MGWGQNAPHTETIHWGGKEGVVNANKDTLIALEYDHIRILNDSAFFCVNKGDMKILNLSSDTIFIEKTYLVPSGENWAEIKRNYKEKYECYQSAKISSENAIKIAIKKHFWEVGAEWNSTISIVSFKNKCCWKISTRKYTYGDDSKTKKIHWNYYTSSVKEIIIDMKTGKVLKKIKHKESGKTRILPC